MSEQDPQVPPQQPPQQQPPQETPATAPPPPPAQPAYAPQGPSGPRASFGQRLVAFLIDWAALIVIILVLYALLDVFGYFLGLLVGLGYFAYFEGGPRGQTFGKRAMGIRVIDFNSGGPIGYGRGVARYLGRILSSLVCYLGYLWMLWDPEKQTWHDKIATTVVVPVAQYPITE
jgi:uncharacterized RDD family membrane protein YckC